MNPSRAAFVLCLCVLFAAGDNCSPLRAEENPAEAAAGSAAAPQAAAPKAADNDQDEDKQRSAMAGLLALCGILIGGLMFVVLVMIWGARLRRLARRELPRQTTLQNEHWFLKPPKGSQESRVESREPDPSRDKPAGS